MTITVKCCKGPYEPQRGGPIYNEENGCWKPRSPLGYHREGVIDVVKWRDKSRQAHFQQITSAVERHLVVRLVTWCLYSMPTSEGG